VEYKIFSAFKAKNHLASITTPAMTLLFFFCLWLRNEDTQLHPLLEAMVEMVDMQQQRVNMCGKPLSPSA